MTYPVATRGNGPVTVTPSDQPLDLPPQFRSGLSARGIDLGDEIGRGVMSLVYRATDRDHARTVAVKVLRPDSGRESTRRLYENSSRGYCSACRLDRQE